MKKIISIITVFVMMVVLVACGNDNKSVENTARSKSAEEQQSEMVSMKEAMGVGLFGSVLSEYQKASKDGNSEKMIAAREKLSTGFGEMRDETNISKKIGYSFMDLNQDGTNELIISMIDKKDIALSYIIAVYMYGNDGPKRIVEGWSRNRYYIVDNYELLNEASGGAGISSFTRKSIRYEGEEITSEISTLSYASSSKILFTYNPNGATKDKEKYKISEKKFNQIRKTWQGNRMNINAKPISEFIVK